MIRLVLFLLVLVLVPMLGFSLDRTISVDHVPLSQVKSALLLSTPAFFFTFLICYLIKRYESLHGRFSHDHDLSGVQKFHTIPVPRVGGLAIFVGLSLSLWTLSIYLPPTGVRRAYLGLLLLASLPVFLGGLIEDLTKNISARRRLLLAFVSAALGILLVHAELHRLDVAWLDPLLTGTFFLLLFTVFSVGGATHSFNLIDGYNGLAGGVGLIVLAATGFVAYGLSDHVVLMLSINMFMATLGFLMWNWPKGRIFLGDGGAYLLGFMIASLLVILLDRNPSVSTWFPLCLVGYPTFETLFSIFRRRFFQKTRHDVPDDLHLHQLIHRQVARLRGQVPHSWIYNNSLTSVPLWLIVSAASLVIVYFYDNTNALMWIYLVGILAYKALYRVLYWLYQRDVA